MSKNKTKAQEKFHVIKHHYTVAPSSGQRMTLWVRLLLFFFHSISAYSTFEIIFLNKCYLLSLHCKNYSAEKGKAALRDNLSLSLSRSTSVHQQLINKSTSII